MFIHETADVAPDVEVGEGTRIWQQVQVMAGSSIGDNCNIGKGVFLGNNTIVGNRVKIQNYANLFGGAILEDDVFISPMVCLIEDSAPRSVNFEGKPKLLGEWTMRPVTVRRGASLGTGVIVLPDLEIGEYAMVCAGSVVNKDVPCYGLVAGNPARLIGYVCRCGKTLRPDYSCECGCDLSAEISGSQSI